ncbi:Golgi apparatus membrane protein tvp23 [Smittium culicis]|uniref:Golgi apparatus membrane protein TVP23 n=1 Tax=Smittium culicis TaxID=133412 RepID=A0A1R1X7Y5_9FUNG|nr:Golgi apparatus membrane protein tvp23 [Smittium culicis]OMJ15384.1 Golgi apparatus membrane protein tvp23 [Smittium culicis]
MGNFFTSSFVLIFVCCILALAFDFWTVKNVSGRYLVGMRWWSEVDDLGHNHWLFESRDPALANTSDSYIFWTMLYATPIIWLFFAIFALFSLKFQWLLIVIIAIVLNYANYLGYSKCDADAKAKFNSSEASSQTGQFMNSLMTNFVTSNLTNRFFNR